MGERIPRVGLAALRPTLGYGYIGPLGHFGDLVSPRIKRSEDAAGR
jgi:hypothetical protein